MEPAPRGAGTGLHPRAERAVTADAGRIAETWVRLAEADAKVGEYGSPEYCALGEFAAEHGAQIGAMLRTLVDLAPELASQIARGSATPCEHPANGRSPREELLEDADSVPLSENYHAVVGEFQRRLVARALAASGGSPRTAAAMLGLSTHGFYRIARQVGIYAEASTHDGRSAPAIDPRDSAVIAGLARGESVKTTAGLLGVSLSWVHRARRRLRETGRV